MSSHRPAAIWFIPVHPASITIPWIFVMDIFVTDIFVMDIGGKPRLGILYLAKPLISLIADSAVSNPYPKRENTASMARSNNFLADFDN
jgi:hypothetical protein